MDLLSTISLAQICHTHLMAKTIPREVTSPIPFPANPLRYLGTPLDVDMTYDMVKWQRMSGPTAALWGNGSGIL